MSCVNLIIIRTTNKFLDAHRITSIDSVVSAKFRVYFNITVLVWIGVGSLLVTEVSMNVLLITVLTTVEYVITIISIEELLKRKHVSTNDLVVSIISKK